VIAEDSEIGRTKAVPPGTPDARVLARRLIEREAVAHPAPGIGASAAHRAQLACERVCRELSRWMGKTGCFTLFNRAVAKIRVVHTSLGEISIRTSEDPYLNGVGQAVEAHGEGPVAAALESVLTEVLELLGRLVGDDLTARILEQNEMNAAHDDGSG